MKHPFKKFTPIPVLTVMCIPVLSCDSEEHRIEYTYRSSNEIMEVRTNAMASGVVSFFGYNQGIFLTSYHRNRRNNKTLDIFLNLDIKIDADKKLVKDRLVWENSAFEAFYDESTVNDDDGNISDRFIQNKPSKGVFCIKEAYLNDEGEPGTTIYFAIKFDDNHVLYNGSFVSEKGAEKVFSEENSGAKPSSQDALFKPSYPADESFPEGTEVAKKCGVSLNE
jgi:hypothetical protein